MSTIFLHSSPPALNWTPSNNTILHVAFCPVPVWVLLLLFVAVLALSLVQFHLRSLVDRRRTGLSLQVGVTLGVLGEELFSVEVP